jgi:Xaa-Pro aminopeptidase
MALPTYGAMAVDWETRIDNDALRRERVARAKRQLELSGIGAFLCFDTANIRYITATVIGTWANDKAGRFCLLPSGGEPYMWDFGSAAKHHALHCPWLEGRSFAGISTQHGAMPAKAERAREVARKIYDVLDEHGLTDEPLGVDICHPPVLFALQELGLQVVDGQEHLMTARTVKTPDEIKLLTHACMMVDAAYERLYEFMKPGVRENDCVAEVNHVLYGMGSEHVEGVNAISGERCSPHPHNFSDRTLRAGDPVYFDIIQSFQGYRTCYYRTFTVGSASNAIVDAYKRCRYYLDIAIDALRPGITTGDIARLWPKAQEFGFPNEEAAFALQYGHGVGLSVWEKPLISRLVSLDHPEPIEEGMVIALETFWPSSDGWSAARIEEQMVVTKNGCEVLTRFPAEELMVAGHRYFSAYGALPKTREIESHRNSERVLPGDHSIPAAAPGAVAGRTEER